MVLAGTVVFTGGFFAAHAVASGWAGAARGGPGPIGLPVQLRLLRRLERVRLAGRGFLAEAGWPGTVPMTTALALTALVLAGLMRPERG